MTDKKLARGYYTPTDNFRAIQEQTAVMFKDGQGLVALTGPAHDKASEKYADLFVEAPNMLAALEEIIEQAEEKMGDWAGVEPPYFPDHLTGYYEIIEIAFAAVKKLRETR